MLSSVDCICLYIGGGLLILALIFIGFAFWKDKKNWNECLTMFDEQVRTKADKTRDISLTIAAAGMALLVVADQGLLAISGGVIAIGGLALAILNA